MPDEIPHPAIVAAGVAVRDRALNFDLPPCDRDYAKVAVRVVLEHLYQHVEGPLNMDWGPWAAREIEALLRECQSPLTVASLPPHLGEGSADV